MAIIDENGFREDGVFVGNAEQWRLYQNVLFEKGMAQHYTRLRQKNFTDVDKITNFLQLAVNVNKVLISVCTSIVYEQNDAFLSEGNLLVSKEYGEVPLNIEYLTIQVIKESKLQVKYYLRPRGYDRIKHHYTSIITAKELSERLSTFRLDMYSWDILKEFFKDETLTPVEEHNKNNI